MLEDITPSISALAAPPLADSGSPIVANRCSTSSRCCRRCSLLASLSNWTGPRRRSAAATPRPQQSPQQLQRLPKYELRSLKRSPTEAKIASAKIRITIPRRMTLELSSIIFLLCQNNGLRQKIERRRSAASTGITTPKKDDNVVIHNQISVVPE